MLTSDLEQLSGVCVTDLSTELRLLKEPGAQLTALEYLLDESTQSLPSRTLIFLLHRMYGAEEGMLRHKLRTLNSLCARFLSCYGDGPFTLMHAPSRINILGEHVDYVSYLPTASLPFGSREHDMLMIYRATEDGLVRGVSTKEEYELLAFNFSAGPVIRENGNEEMDWLSYLCENAAPQPDWGNYVKGAVYFARVKYGKQVRLGFDFVVDSSIPPGGGASSSSALVVLGSAAIREVNHLKYTLEELAREAARAEWYVGTRGGAMDHTTICLAKRRRAVLIEYGKATARPVPLEDRTVRWVTFFSQPADKGREVMIEYNERAAVSRLLIPAVIESWKAAQPERYRAWRQAVEAFQAGSVAALDEIEELLNGLPQTLVLSDIARDYPEAFGECNRAFPALVKDRWEYPLKLRARAFHHVGEVRRVALATLLLDNDFDQPVSGADTVGQQDPAMRSLGSLLNESHESLRDLYGVSTPDVEQLIKIIRSNPNVYGARLMGGGFGGIVLALAEEQDVNKLISQVQTEYYGPQNRCGIREGSVMVSTPGDGLSSIRLESVWRETVEQFNSLGNDTAKYRESMAVLLDSFRLDADPEEVWPVIVAAGKGVRARATGLEVSKPVASVLGVPAILRVMLNIRAALPKSPAPIVIVSPETEREVRAALAGTEVTFVLQPEPLGTGDAVLFAHEQMRDFSGRALVIWSTQPVVQPETMRRALTLAALFDDNCMVLPTAIKERPYAPLLRDDGGRVRGSQESHLERAEPPLIGETNIGLFLLHSPLMFAALCDLNRRYWNESSRRYERVGGELGFPNELINYFCERDYEVFACPIADSREEQGIKTLEDVGRCERFISQLTQQPS